jgi:hypothetical protein
LDTSTVEHARAFSEEEKEIRSLYAKLIAGWNERSAKSMAAPFAPEAMETQSELFQPYP